MTEHARTSKHDTARYSRAWPRTEKRHTCHTGIHGTPPHCHTLNLCIEWKTLCLMEPQPFSLDLSLALSRKAPLHCTAPPALHPPAAWPLPLGQAPHHAPPLMYAPLRCIPGLLARPRGCDRYGLLAWWPRYGLLACGPMEEPDSGPDPYPDPDPDP